MNWWLLVGLSAITFANRYAFFAAAIRYQPGAKTRRFLSYSSFAILTSIWTPILFQYDAQDGISHAGSEYLLAGSLAAVLSIARFRSIVVVLLSTSVFFVLRFIIFRN